MTNDATLAQVRAARPDASTWLAANAGSGKTRVLTDRVARLLLDGVQPQHILCLTYTKAAASEMQNRLFDRLGTWAMLPQADLRTALSDLGAPTPIADDTLRQARTLFARAIETPGGLKIQTIHSFCAALLRRFPLEAQVSPQFTEIEERSADLLRTEILDRMADGPDAPVLEAAARLLSSSDLSGLGKQVVRLRDQFQSDLDRAGAMALFQLPPDMDETQILRGVFEDQELPLLGRIIPHLHARGGNDAKAAHALREITAPDIEALKILESKMINASGKNKGCAKIGSFPTKDTRKVIGDDLPPLEALMQRVEIARRQRVAFTAAEKTLALHQFAHCFLQQYQKEKQLRGWLDFDDLIFKARDLLTDPAVAAWVLYRIDGGIDHILVDEAQDTSPTQWDVISKLAAEFSSGEGARSDILRTIFVVGDKKQSIFSFQGADPREFDRMQQEFQSKLTGAGQPFQNLTLEYSFRSSQAILRLVDTVFAQKGAAGFPAGSLHRAFKDEMPGRVDLWPVIANAPPTDHGPWYQPVDKPAPTQGKIILAQKIAREIKRMIDNGDTIPDEDPNTRAPIRRPITPRDFLILVRKRTGIFPHIIRACKAIGLPIAGSDRLRVGAELAVRDLQALLSFLALPEDSLSLATALRSPLFGWDEQALFSLAHHRKQDHLWQALRTSDGDAATTEILMDLRNHIDFLRPYDLIERILTRHGGRRKLLARLGTEAEDGINALLKQALAYESNAVPSLTGFLAWLESDDLEIKRQIDSASDQIRVMTVHGAKGLEAPIVILPEAGKLQSGNTSDPILPLHGTPTWHIAAKDRPEIMDSAVEDQSEVSANENLRLLYVGLTRAEKWLIVAASGDLDKGDSWYEMVQTAMQDLNAVQQGEILRLAHGDWEAGPECAPAAQTGAAPAVPAHLSQPAPRPQPLAQTLSPSDLGGAKALASERGRDEAAAMAHGTQVHRALDFLSRHAPQDWPEIEARQNLDPAAAAEARVVLTAPALAQVFAPGTLAEVPLSAALGSHRIHGIVDRLIVTQDRVLAIDFKTNAAVPATAGGCPDGILRQMGAYSHALAQIFAGKTIETAIIWTKTAELMPLPHDIVMQALKATPYLDEAVTAS